MNFKIQISILLFLLFGRGFAPAQNASIVSKTDYIISVQNCFDKAYDEITAMLDGKQQLSFKRAVYLVENAYLFDSLNYSYFLSIIEGYKKIVLAFNKANRLKNYNFIDSTSNSLKASLFKLFTDTIFDSNKKIISLPFKYDFKDVFGNGEYYNTFVTKLFLTNKGNCHSLPYLYKILSEEIGTKAYLALAPMHIYIKERNKKVNWYNVELTSAQHPIDAYLVATGFISRENILSGIYMDTLSLKESVATCLIDLCYSYKHRLDSSASLDFMLKCADKSLSIKPNYVNALLRKCEIHQESQRYFKSINDTAGYSFQHRQLTDTRKKLIALGYQDIPADTFNKWFLTYQQNKSKYTNKDINTNFKPNLNK